MAFGQGERRGNGTRDALMRRVVRLSMRAATTGATIVLVGAASACVADPLDDICPTDALVITEVRGPQSTPDTFGQWIEIANTSDETVDLLGLHLSNRTLQNSEEHTAIVRYRHEVVAGDRFVMGAFFDDDRPVYVDYGLGLDWVTDRKPDDGADYSFYSIHGSGFLELLGCGETIDRIVYDGLPRAGSYSLGLRPPDAVGNDDPEAWCTDDLPRRKLPPFDMLGNPGSPGEVNPLCD
jgi:hypothetical protein